MDEQDTGSPPAEGGILDARPVVIRFAGEANRTGVDYVRADAFDLVVHAMRSRQVDEDLRAVLKRVKEERAQLAQTP